MKMAIRSDSTTDAGPGSFQTLNSTRLIQVKRPRTHGVSLVELLVVIGIMVAVLAVAIPVVRLTTSDNRVSLATQSIRSFLQGAALQADRHGKSYVIFERSANAPDLCYRLFMGRPRAPYRGEDETSYAIMAPSESVVLNGVPDVANIPNTPGPMSFSVFYLFNADASKVRPFQYLTFRDRPEKYLVYQAFQMPQGNSARPYCKVFCRIDPKEPLNPVSIDIAGQRPLAPRSEFQAVGSPHANWVAAGATLPQKGGSGGVAVFWPADRVYYPNPSAPGFRPADPTDIPNFSVGAPGQFISRLLSFEVSQPPAIDELNTLELPDGMAIYLGASGFDIDGFTLGGAVFENFLPYRHFAFRDDMGSLTLDGNVATALENEVLDPNFQFTRNQESVVRPEYFPRIEFEAGGRIHRAFSMSPRYAAATSYALNANDVRLTRQGPITPLFPLFLLVGEDNPLERSTALSGVLANDYWVMLGAQTSTPKIVKAEMGVPLDQAHVNVANSVSER